MALAADINMGDVISFSSIVPTDLNMYKGTVIGIANSKVAVTFQDIYTYNNNAKAIDNTIPDTDLLEFLIIELMEPISGSSRFMLVFSREWISEATLNIIATERVAVFEVFDTDENNASDVVDLLRSAGLKSRVIELR